MVVTEGNTLELRSHWDNGKTEGRALTARSRTKLVMFEIQKGQCG